jgi:biotin synthase
MKVNCHIIVGLGETDRELVNMFYQLKSEQIACYLFSFNPEPGTSMQDAPRAPMHRWRRIQLAKHLLEERNLPPDAIEFDAEGNIERVDAADVLIEGAIESGVPFMTNGCPDREGNMTCNRPYGSYRPGEEFRDYPVPPNDDDLVVIRKQLRLADGVVGNGVVE